MLSDLGLLSLQEHGTVIPSRWSWRQQATALHESSVLQEFFWGSQRLGNGFSAYRLSHDFQPAGVAAS